MHMKDKCVIETNTNDKSFVIDVSHFSDGAYIVEMIGGYGVFQKTIVKR